MTNRVQAMLSGGRAVVKIRVRIRLTRYSLITRSQMTNAPTEARALPNVPHSRSMSAMQSSVRRCSGAVSPSILNMLSVTMIILSQPEYSFSISVSSWP